MTASPELQLPPGWDFVPDNWPERSVLHGYAPRGIGTAMVASLAGHLVDLAWSHGVPPVELLRWVADAGSQPGVPGRTRADFEAMARNLLRKPRASLVGPTTTSAILVEAIERMTLRDDAGATTVNVWEPVLPFRNAFRSQRAYCPCCYWEWSPPPRASDGSATSRRTRRIYEPLLWQFQSLTVCVKHEVTLRSACLNPACGSRRAALTAWARPGFCGTCGSFLGARRREVIAAEGRVDPGTLDWQRYVTGALSDLITSPPASGEVISPLATPAAVELAVVRSFGGRYTPFAAAIRKSGGTVSLWKDCRRRPELDSALRICAVAGFRLPDFLAGRIDALSASPLPARVPHIPQSDETHQVHDHAAVEAHLEQALVADPPPSRASVNLGLHIDPRQLYRLFPEACRRIRDRHRDWVEECSLAAQRQRQELVLAAMAALHAENRYPSRHQVDKLLPSTVRLRNPVLNRLWKDELVQLGYPRPDKPVRSRACGADKSTRPWMVHHPS